MNYTRTFQRWMNNVLWVQGVMNYTRTSSRLSNIMRMEMVQDLISQKYPAMYGYNSLHPVPHPHTSNSMCQCSSLNPSLLFADDDGATRIQDGLIVLVGVACLRGDDIHIGAVFALTIFALDNGGDAR